MKKLILLLLIALVGSAYARAHTAFTLVSSEKKSIKAADITSLEKGQSPGRKEGSNLAFGESEIRLVVLTGPPDDMVSYRIQGIRNPTLVVPAGATLKILFVNVDADMPHDIRFGHFTQPFHAVVDEAETAGSTKLMKRSADGTLQAEEIVVKANANGLYRYLCSVRGHARDGMWGHIAVGVKPDVNVKPPEKVPHVHAPGEEHDHAQPGQPAATPSPTPHGEHHPAQPAASPTPHADHHQAQPTSSPATHGGHAQPGGTPAAGEHGAHSKEMSSTVDVGDPMNREGSGTSWLPDSSPMHAWSKMYGDGGMLMLMGAQFLRYTQVGSSRDISVAGKGGRSRFDAPNMFMAMYSRPLSNRSQLGLRVMASSDPLIERGYGYPLLYQSGELKRTLGA